MQKRRLAGASALGILVAVGLSGCVKMDMQLDLQSDDTVDGSLVFAVSTAVAELAGESPESIAEQLQGEAFDMGGGGTTRTEPYDDGEYIGSTTFFEGKPLEEFDDPDSVSIVHEGDEFIVSGAFDMTDATEGAEAMPGLTDSLDVRISVSFPGAVSSHNGTLDGNTVTWQAVPGERLELEARGSAVEGGGGSLPLPLLIGAGLAVLLLVGLILFLVLRRKKGAPAPATAYPTGQYPTMPAYAPGAAGPAGVVPPPPAPPVTTEPPAPLASAEPPAPPAPPAPPGPPAEPKADQGPPPPPPA